MSKIRLPRTVLEDGKDDLTIRHEKTGVTVQVSKDKLDTWCIGQLRAMISAPTVPAVAPGKLRTN